MLRFIVLFFARLLILIGLSLLSLPLRASAQTPSAPEAQSGWQTQQVARASRMMIAAANPLALMGGTDAGAHLTMFCGAGSNLHLITHWARDERVMLSHEAWRSNVRTLADDAWTKARNAASRLYRAAKSKVKSEK